MRLSKRWKTGLLITAYVAAIAVMVRYAYPNSFRRASQFGQYQHELSRSIAEQRARELAEAAAPAAEPPPAPPAD